VQVDISHRADLVIYDEKAYQALAERCVFELSRIPNVVSIVVCGSLAKGDLVPGWSDIDIIVFVDLDPSIVTILERIKRAIELAKGTIAVGIGLDIVYESQFLDTHKLCGRPYMMTYEVAGYGQLRHGRDLFHGISYDGFARLAVDHERHQLIAAEVHSWRRAYVNRKPDQQEIAWLFTCAKALLRILQCETGPNLVVPISCRGSLERFIAANPRHLAVAAFSSCVDIRSRWFEYFHSSTAELVALAAPLVVALNSYPLLLPKA
jgi:predicted nucleotidyltransferase